MYYKHQTAIGEMLCEARVIKSKPEGILNLTPKDIKDFPYTVEIRIYVDECEQKHAIMQEIFETKEEANDFAAEYVKKFHLNYTIEVQNNHE